MSDLFWAAFGGGAAAGVFVILAVAIGEWVRWFLDRPLVRLEVRLGFVFGDAAGVHYVFFEASNPHSRPVILQGVGLTYKREREATISILPAELSKLFPYQLDGGRLLIQKIPVQELIDGLKQVDRRPSDLTGVWFRSRTGKFFSGRIKKEVIEQLEAEYGEIPV